MQEEQETAEQQQKTQGHSQNEETAQQLNFFEPAQTEQASSPSTISEEAMTINLQMPDITELKPKITVFGVGGAGGNAVNNMIKSGLEGVEFVVANTDAQALTSSHAERVIQMGLQVTEGLGAGSQPEIGRQAAEEVIDEINGYLSGSHMAFITAGMGGGTGTGAAPIVARAARDMGILTVGVVTKPFQFEGGRRMRLADAGIEELQANVDTLIVIPNQNLFRIANEKTTFADAFSMADQVLYSGVACITDLMVKEGLINLDFADVRSVMREMGKAMMGTGEASGDNRAIEAAEAAIANPLLDETSMQGAQGLLISITGGNDLTLFEVDEAATRIREEVDPDANIILGATFDEALEGVVRVSVVATGIEKVSATTEIPEVKAASTFMRKANDILTETTQPAPVSDEAVETSVEKVAPESVAKPAPVAEKVTSSQEAAVVAEPEAAKTDPDVMITPFTPSKEALEMAKVSPKLPVMEELEKQIAVKEEPVVPTQPFIPPVADTPIAQPRIPNVDDFPMVVQEEIRAKAASSLDLSGMEEQDKGALGLLKRITTATLGARKDGSEMESDEDLSALVPTDEISVPKTATMKEPAPVAKPIVPTQASAFAKPAQPNPQAPNVAVKTPVEQQASLDAQGRPIPKQNAAAVDDPLEIPAFLRRQAQ